MTKKQRKIVKSYHLHDTADISDERLLAVVSDECNCDASDVIYALIAENKEDEHDTDCD